VPWHCEADRSRMRPKPGAAQGATKGSRGVVRGELHCHCRRSVVSPIVLFTTFFLCTATKSCANEKGASGGAPVHGKNVLDLWIMKN